MESSHESHSELEKAVVSSSREEEAIESAESESNQGNRLKLDNSEVLVSDSIENVELKSTRLDPMESETKECFAKATVIVKSAENSAFESLQSGADVGFQEIAENFHISKGPTDLDVVRTEEETSESSEAPRRNDDEQADEEEEGSNKNDLEVIDQKMDNQSEFQGMHS